MADDYPPPDPTEANPYPFGLLQALTYAIGRDLQYLAGLPALRTSVDFDVGDTVLSVGSTWGFPDSGALWAPNSRGLTYTGKTSTQLTGVAKVHEDFKPIPRGTLMVLDVKRAVPDTYYYPWSR